MRLLEDILVAFCVSCVTGDCVVIYYASSGRDVADSHRFSALF